MSELQIFFLVSGIGTLVFLSIPMTISPLWWAKHLRWPEETPTNLTLYLGRSLGALGLSLGVVGIIAALTNDIPPLFLLLVVLIGTSATLVHLYGALRKIQPLTETIEILIYGAWTLWGLSLYWKGS